MYWNYNTSKCQFGQSVVIYIPTVSICIQTYTASNLVSIICCCEVFIRTPVLFICIQHKCFVMKKFEVVPSSSWWNHLLIILKYRNSSKLVHGWLFKQKEEELVKNLILPEKLTRSMNWYVVGEVEQRSAFCKNPWRKSNRKLWLCKKN